MAVIDKAENAALSYAIANAALDQALALLDTDKEAIRAAHWNNRSTAARRVAVMCANMPKERADCALKEFNAMERGTICINVRRLIKQLETIALSMQGGAMPDKTGGDRTHQVNGITDIGTVQ